MQKSIKIRIVKIPLGEAPIHIRKAWIGLILPLLANDYKPQIKHTAGILSGPKSLIGMLGAICFGKTKRKEGYLVDSNIAINLLEQNSPEAADWWKTNAPHIMRPGFGLSFNTDACEEVYE
ncbi:MAG: hypothetical protein ISS16_10075 [Ignavibacteria bacterium]|nr:hypothetical protein [Ignavibacteria bacterium]